MKPLQPRCLSAFLHINRYWDRQHDCWAAKILPGEFYVTQHDEMVATVLGSCVSACIRDVQSGVGGMNHFMLPLTNKDANDGSLLGLSTRYGNYAMEHLINEIFKAGGARKNLEIKVFGGGRVLRRMTMDIGKRNIDFVHHYLRAEGLPIVAEDVGDVYPRKVLYRPATGKVLMKKLESMHNDTIEKRENEYYQNIIKKPDISGEIELF